ncbi:MAG: CapA family protein, partial [Lachnospiraceae bacterium]|nr:CapA family protein [Lachnospiraceae bacterium]
MNHRPKSKAYKKKQRERLLIRLITYIIVAAMIVTFILSAVSCNKKKRPETDNQETTMEESAASDMVKLVAVGDIIGHDTILNLAKTDNGYDFSSLFALLKDDILSVDLAIANVETPLGGGPYTGYPSFNTPDEMGLAVIDAGFDVALQASNHSMDSGSNGVHHSINFW